MADELDDRSFEQAIFLDFFHQLGSAFTLEIRNRSRTYLLGTGNLYDTVTRAKYFQLEQRYAFDRKELLRDLRKLVRHIARECIAALKRDLKDQFGVKNHQTWMLLLVDPALVPAVWLTVLERPNPLAGCVQVNLRLTICLPHDLPLGPDHAQTIKSAEVARNLATSNFDQQVSEDRAREKRDTKIIRKG